MRKHTKQISKRIMGLDILRIFAVVSIFCFHCNIHLGSTFGILTGYIANGAVTMILFFMLSGFVLQIKYNEISCMEKKSMGSFYMKRIIGLYPLYLVTLFLYGAIFVREGLKKIIILLPIEIFGLQGFFDTLYMEWNNSGTWFVTSLLCCYLLYPCLTTVFKLLDRKQRYIAGVIMYIISSISPVLASVLGCRWIYPKPVFRLLEFAIGILIAIEIKETILSKQEKYQGVGAISLCILIIIIIILDHFNLGTYASYNFVAIPIFSISLFAFYYLKGSNRIVSFFAGISYAFIYAQLFVFKPINYLIKTDYINNGFIAFIVALFASLIIAVLLNKCIERPIANYIINRRKDIN